MTAKKIFPRIGLVCKPGAADALETMQTLIAFLQAQDHKIFLDNESELAPHFAGLRVVQRELLAQSVDLVIVVGGDGSFLSAARTVVSQDIPVIGVNRGGLGFLTDIQPHEIEEKIGAILKGRFVKEQRFLLQAKAMRGTSTIAHGTALNDCVLYSGDLARMIEFEVYIDDRFMCSMRSDGLIVSTPTGSTAYALSGGGPILEPDLKTIVLVPMHPHTFIEPTDCDRQFKIDSFGFNASTRVFPSLSCDGQQHFRCVPHDVIEISRYQHALTLIHPEQYDYYEILRRKLQWGNKLTNTSA